MNCLPAPESPETSPSPLDVTARAKGGRSRPVEPAPCRRDGSDAEDEFLTALRAYKPAGGRMFPSWSEVLEVARGLGYERAAIRVAS